MIAIIKYNAGNIRSVQNALNRLDCASIITDDPELAIKLIDSWKMIMIPYILKDIVLAFLAASLGRYIPILRKMVE